MTAVPVGVSPGAQLEAEIHAAIDRIWNYYRLRPVLVMAGTLHYERMWEEAHRKAAHPGVMPEKAQIDVPVDRPRRLTFWYGPDQVEVREDPSRDDIAILIDGCQLVQGPRL